MSVVLIVDDNQINLKTLQIGLSQYDYEIHEASNGEDALKLAQSIRPDIIVLDVMMPKMNGFEVCRRLKQNSSTDDIPVIFVTALEEIVDKLRGFDVGGDDYITKPFVIEEVNARLKVHIALREQRRLVEQRRQDDLDYFVGISELKNELIYQLKHDVKNPIASILLSIHLLQRQFGADEQIREYTARMKASTNEIMRLVENLLEIAKLETGRSIQHFSSVDLHAFLNGICKLFYTQSETSDIAFHTDFDGVLGGYQAYFDPNQMTSALSNLLANAFKYTLAGGAVRFIVTVSAQEILFQIADTGCGIAQDELPFVFQRFYRATQMKDKVEGTGLGLYIVKSIVEQHHGRVWIDSEIGMGSKVSVSIPILIGECAG